MPAEPVRAMDWLVARPIAHRGLHDVSCGVVENSLEAARRAVARGFAIECDVQLSADGEVVVFHDFTLERLTGRKGELRVENSAVLRAIGYRHGAGCIPSLSDLLDLIDGRVPLVCEIKSRFDGDLRLADRVRSLIEAYRGPVALKSFDPDVIVHLREQASYPLGIVAEASYDDPEYAELDPLLKRRLAQFLHFPESRPDFLSYHVGDLPHAVPFLCQTALGMPVMTWTVRRPEQRSVADRWADQIIFEGFLP